MRIVARGHAMCPQGGHGARRGSRETRGGPGGGGNIMRNIKRNLGGGEPEHYEKH